MVVLFERMCEYDMLYVQVFSVLSETLHQQLLTT